jgi:hypothetical protein
MVPHLRFSVSLHTPFRALGTEHRARMIGIQL